MVKSPETIVVVAFSAFHENSIGYIKCKGAEDASKQVLRLLSEPNNADVISIRRVPPHGEES